MKRRRLKILLLTLPLVMFFVLWGSIYLLSKTAINTSYSFNSKTEGVNIDTGSNSELKWSFSNTTILADKEILSKNFSIKFNDSVKIKVVRIADGPLKISLSTNNSSVGGFYVDDIFQENLGDEVYLFANNINQKASLGKTIVLPLNGVQGSIITSEPVGFESSSTIPLSRSGKVMLINSSFDGDDIYNAGEFDLKNGEQFIIENRSSPYYGFIVVNEESCLNISYKVSGSKGYIVKAGGTALELKSTLLTKINNDSFYQWLSLAFGALLILISFFNSLLDIFNYFK